MNKWLKLGLCLLIMVFCFAILMISLISGSQINRDEDFAASKKHFYIGREMLPDHIFYPLLMINDRLRLMSVSPKEGVFLQIELAKRRLLSANALMKRNNEKLAWSTLVKAQKYIIKAATDAIYLETTFDEKKAIVEAIEAHDRNVADIRGSFPAEYQNDLNKLNDELENVRRQLANDID